MATIDSLVSELNELCRQFIAQKEQFNEFDRIREVFKEINSQGYSISWPLFSFINPEYELLSSEGKYDMERLIDFSRMKLEAINEMNFERAADLRDIERELIRKIKLDFSRSIENQHFIVAGKYPEVVIFNDPDSLLITLFK
ncbi:MAG: hypothetical protein WCK09_21110 [Bacteroidota bacterium]